MTNPNDYKCARATTASPCHLISLYTQSLHHHTQWFHCWTDKYVLKMWLVIMTSLFIQHSACHMTSSSDCLCAPATTVSHYHIYDKNFTVPSSTKKSLLHWQIVYITHDGVLWQAQMSIKTAKPDLWLECVLHMSVPLSSQQIGHLFVTLTKDHFKHIIVWSLGSLFKTFYVSWLRDHCFICIPNYNNPRL